MIDGCGWEVRAPPGEPKIARVHETIGMRRGSMRISSKCSSRASVSARCSQTSPTWRLRISRRACCSPPDAPISHGWWRDLVAGCPAAALPGGLDIGNLWCGRPRGAGAWAARRRFGFGPSSGSGRVWSTGVATPCPSWLPRLEVPASGWVAEWRIALSAIRPTGKSLADGRRSPPGSRAGRRGSRRARDNHRRESSKHPFR